MHEKAESFFHAKVIGSCMRLVPIFLNFQAIWRYCSLHWVITKDEYRHRGKTKKVHGAIFAEKRSKWKGKLNAMELFKICVWITLMLVKIKWIGDKGEYSRSLKNYEDWSVPLARE